MESRQRYTEVKDYDVDDFFLESLQDFELPIAIKIAMFLEENKIEVQTNNLVSHVLGGLIIYNEEPITFAIEIVKSGSEYMVFTDIKEISMDEYLDLINLNLYVKSNEFCKDKQA
tara:strand:- start:6664 stop:7008 length:345 start_codon:yes stop_codon:yes gene_type:complete